MAQRKTPPGVKIGIGDWRVGAVQYVVNDFESISFADSLLKGPQVTFKTSGYSNAGRYIRALESDVYVFLLGEKFARCRVIDVQREWGPDDTDTLSVTAVGYERRFDRLYMHADLQWSTPTDQAQIVWGLISHAQQQPGGNLGITAGTLEAGTPRVRTEWVKGDNIGQRLQQLSEVIDGPWWGIDADLRLNVWKRSSFPTAAAPIIRGDAATHVTHRPSSDRFANAVLGAGNQSSTTVETLDAPNIETDPRGRWEAMHGWPSVVKQSTLVEHVEGALSDDQSPLASWAATIEPRRWLKDADYRVGEIVQVTVPRSKVRRTPAVEAVVQITDLQVSYDGKNGLGVQLGMDDIE